MSYINKVPWDNYDEPIRVLNKRVSACQQKIDSYTKQYHNAKTLKRAANRFEKLKEWRANRAEALDLLSQINWDIIGYPNS